ncbi:MAG: hypothetical protein HY331_00155 [Chloroflexi bacterium]|nr:hypothetical protein [Chloroflexota bacterium]
MTVGIYSEYLDRRFGLESEAMSAELEELEEIAELRRLALEMADPKPKLYTTT